MLALFGVSENFKVLVQIVGGRRVVDENSESHEYKNQSLIRPWGGEGEIWVDDVFLEYLDSIVYLSKQKDSEHFDSSKGEELK